MKPFAPLDGLPIRMTPAHPAGDPEPRPPTPTPPNPPHDPGDPVHAPRPSEPELPAVDPHEPGLPDPRIDHPCHMPVRQRWLI